MIKSQAQQTLFMNFDNIKIWQGRPSDIDMVYIGESYVIIGEIKNELGTYSENQKRLHKKFANMFRVPVFILYLTHNEKVQDGATEVDVSKCIVKEYYFKGQWHTPKSTLTCQEAFDKITERYF